LNFGVKIAWALYFVVILSGDFAGITRNHAFGRLVERGHPVRLSAQREQI
jgi:hypothetical protein